VSLTIMSRSDFEAWRYCRRCGRKLAYLQWRSEQNGRPVCENFDKRCPTKEVGHDWLDYSHPWPHVVRGKPLWPQDFVAGR